MLKRLLAVLLMISLMTQTAFAYSGASNWAIGELDKAEGYGLITDKIKGNMKAAITREEFAEIAVKLYEISTGKKVEFDKGDVFSDTKNQEILKAYHLKIVNGTDMEKKLFSPNILTNREQVAAMLYRALQGIKPSEAFTVSGSLGFSDGNLASSYAVDALKFMSKNDLLKGSNGKIDPKGTCTREMAVIIAYRIFEKLKSGDFIKDQNSGQNVEDNSDFNPEWLVINDFPVIREDYRYLKSDEGGCIFVNLDMLEHALVMPGNGYYKYPDIAREGDSIFFSWKSAETDQVFLVFEISLSSATFYVNGDAYDGGYKSFVEGEKVFINIIPFVAGLDMELTEDVTQDIAYIQYKTAFPESLLYGTWSDVDGGFLSFRDVVTGVVSLSSFASSYTFNEDGTYTIIMVNVGGFTDKLVRQTGKYMVIGNTIVYYDILETLYEGEPFQLIYENQVLEKPSFDFIENFDQNGPKILINNWLNKQQG